MTVDHNYFRSNKETLPKPTDKSALKNARNLYNFCREIDEIKQQNLQDFSNAVLKMFGLSPIPVKFEGKQPCSKRSKTLGVHRTCGNSRDIQIYKFTAKQQKVRASKSAVDTLIHEIMHELDVSLIKLTDSIHSAGFYKRISQLKDILSA